MASEKASELWGRQLSERTDGRFGRATTVLTTVADIGSFDPGPTVRDPDFAFFGLGVARGNHQTLGDGVLYVVLLLGGP
jgi:hypothetical protein